MALGAGLVRDSLGSYDVAWWSAGGICLLAAVMSYLIQMRPSAPTVDGPVPEAVTIAAGN